MDKKDDVRVGVSAVRHGVRPGDPDLVKRLANAAQLAVHHRDRGDKVRAYAARKVHRILLKQALRRGIF